MPKYANNSSRIVYGIDFEVNKQQMAQLRSELQSLQNMTVDVFASSSNRTGSLGEVTKQLNQVKQSAKELEGAFDKAFNTHLGELNLTKLNAELNKLPIKQILSDLNSAGFKGTQAFANMASSITQTNLQLRQSHKLLDSIGTTLGNTIKWGIASSTVAKVTSSISEAWNYTKALDSSLNDIRIVTNKSADEMERFARQANKAAQGIRASTKEYTNASLIYYQQGLGDTEAKARTEVTLKAANVTGQSGQATSDQLTAIWNGYGINENSALGLEESIDKVAKVAAASAADLEELATGMSKVASAANSAGVDFDQLNATLGTVISVTREAPETIGSAFKTIYARLGDLKLGKTDEDGVSLGTVSSQLEKLGVQVLDQTGDMRDMGDIVEDVAEKWQTWTQAQRQAAAVAMAGKMQYSRLIALFDHWDMYTEYLNDSVNALGELQKEQDIYMDRTSAHLQQLKTAWERIFDSLIDNKGVNGIIDVLTGLTNGIANFTEAVGSGGNLLLMFGSIATKVFSQQLAKSIQVSINNMTAEKKNIAEVNAKIEALQKLSDNSEKSHSGIDARIKQLELLKDNLKNMSAEEIKNISDTITKYGELADEVDIVNDKRKQAKEFLEATVEGSSEQTKNMYVDNGSNRNTHSLETQIEGNKKELISSEKSVELLEKAIARGGKATEGFGNLVKNVIEKAEADWTQYSTVPAASTQKLEKEIKKVNQAVKNAQKKSGNEDLDLADFLIGENYDKEVSAAFAYFQKKYKEMLEAMEGEFNNLDEIIANGGGKEWSKRVEKEAGDVRESIENIWDETAQQKALQGFVNMTSAVTSLVSAVMTLKNIGNIWNDEDLSSGEKILQITMAVSSAIGQFTFAIKNLKDSYKDVYSGMQKLAFSQLGEAEAATIGSAANMGFGATLKGVKDAALSALVPLWPYVAVITAVGLAVWGVVKAYNADADAAKEDAERVKELKEVYTKTSEELQKFQTQLKDYTSATESIKKLTKGTNEYRQALLKANEKALELLQTNKELAQYAYRDSDGMIIISQEGLDKVTSQYLQNQETAQANLYEAQYTAAASQLKSDLTDFKRKYGSYQAVSNADKDADLGQYGQGNIDLWNRPKYQQPDGSISTVNSVSFWSEEEQKEILVPLIQQIGNDIVEVSEEEAQKIYEQNGKFLGKFDNSGEATDYAVKLHEAQDYRYNGNIGSSGRQRINDDIIYKIADYMSEEKLTSLVKADLDKIEGLSDVSGELRASIVENIDAYVRMANSINNTKKEQQLYADAIAEARLKMVLGDEYSKASRSEQNVTKAIYNRKNNDVEQKQKDVAESTTQYQQDVFNNLMDKAGDNPLVQDAYIQAYTTRSMGGGYSADDAKVYAQMKGYNQDNFSYNFFKGGYDFYDNNKNWKEFVKGSDLIEKINTLLVEQQYAKEAGEEAPALIKTIDGFTKALEGSGVENLNVLNYLLKSANANGDKRIDATQKSVSTYKKDDEGNDVLDENGNKIIEKIDVAGTMTQAMAKQFLQPENLEKIKETLNGSDFWQQQGFESAEQYYNALVEWLNERANTTDAESLGMDYIKVNQNAAKTVEEQALSGKLTPKELTDEYKSLASNIEQIKDLYPELTNEIQTFNEEGMIGTQQWFQSLYGIKEKLNDLKLDKLSEEYEKKLDDLDKVREQFTDEESGELNIEAMLDSTEFDNAMKELMDADYDINVEIHAQAEEAFDNFETATKNMAAQAAKIGENYVVAADDVRELNNAFPGIINGMKAVGDGSVQLKQDVVQSAMAAAEGEMQASAKSTLAQLEGQAKTLRAKQATYKSMGDAAMALAKHEGNLEENKAKISEGFEHLKDLNNEATANKEKERDGQVATNSHENASILAKNWSSAYESAANSAIAFAETAVSAHQVAVNGEGTAKKGDFSVTYTGNNGKSSEAAGLAELQSAADAAASDTDWKALAEQFYNAATVAGRGANDIEGMIAQIGARSIETGKSLSNIAKGKGANPKESGGGSKASEPDKMDTLEDKPDVYHDVNVQLELISKNLDKVQSQTSKLFGKNLIDNLNKQLNLLNKQIDTSNEKIRIARGEASRLQQELGTKGVAFNSDGTIANYANAYNAQLAYVNSIIANYNSMTKEQQEAYKDTVEQAKKDFEDFKKALDEYDDTITNIIPDLEKDIQDAIDKQIEINIQKFNMEIEIRLDMKEAEKDWLDFKKKVIDQIKEDDIFGNATANLAQWRSYYNGEAGNIIEKNAQHLRDIMGQLDQINQGGISEWYGDNQAKALEDLQNYYKELMQELEDMQDLADEIEHSYLDMMDEAKEKLEDQVALYEQINDIIEHDKKVIELIYGEDSYKDLAKYYEQQHQNNLQNLDFQRREVDF